MPAFLPLTEDKSKLRKKKQHNLLSHNHLPITALCILLFVIYNVFTHYFLLTKKEWYHSDNYVNQKCRPLIPIEQPDPSKLSPERRHRFLQVRNAIRHAWRGYANVVSLNSSSWWTTTTSGGTIIPHDDLSPVSHTAFSWLNYGATLHDSIDTLYLANLMEEYDQAVQWLTSYDIQTTSIQPTKTFGTFASLSINFYLCVKDFFVFFDGFSDNDCGSSLTFSFLQSILCVSLVGYWVHTAFRVTLGCLLPHKMQLMLS